MNNMQRRTLIVAILASFVAFLDVSVINVALPAISRELGGGLSTQQWVVDSYLITLGALILIAGSLSDLFGRKRILRYGLIGFGLASVLCALAPTPSFLVVARALQGVAGAMLVPSSLALIISAFSGPAQGKAIGSWTAWTGIAFIIGPLLGGLMVDLWSWRLVFAINVLPIVAVLFLMKRLSSDEAVKPGVKVDIRGAVLAALGLGLPVFGLIEQPKYGWDSPLIYGSLIIGMVMLTAFLMHERRIQYAMLPLELFRVRNFSAGNLAAAAIYGGLTAMTFLLAIFLQQVAGYSATGAGMALLPIPVIMFLLSPRFGELAGRFGPRWFMAAGPAISSMGVLLLIGLGEQAPYWSGVLPGVAIFGLGLSVTVAPLTAAILGSINSRHAGIGSAVNNAVARIAGLITIAALGLLTSSNLGAGGYQRGMILTAVLLFVGATISAIGIQNPSKSTVERLTSDS